MKIEYVHNPAVHNFWAANEVVPVVMEMVRPQSVLDVGCGTGTWLKIFAEHGVEDYLGIDGDNVSLASLKIPQDHFEVHDLSESWSLNRKFDLVVCLEVAEHLPAMAAEGLVLGLISHGDNILFSSAIPGQIGQNHINEQWPEYWQALFGKHGYYFHDVIRPLIWDNDKIEYWYRQNTFLVQRGHKPETPEKPLAKVHPELHKVRLQNEKDYFESLTTGRQGVLLGWKIFLNSILFKIKSIFQKKNS